MGVLLNPLGQKFIRYTLIQLYMVEYPEWTEKFLIDAEKEDIANENGWARGIVVHEDSGKEYDSLIEHVEEFEHEVQFYPFGDVGQQLGSGFAYVNEKSMESETLLSDEEDVNEVYYVKEYTAGDNPTEDLPATGEGEDTNEDEDRKQKEFEFDSDPEEEVSSESTSTDVDVNVDEIDWSISEDDVEDIDLSEEEEENEATTDEEDNTDNTADPKEKEE